MEADSADACPTRGVSCGGTCYGPNTGVTGILGSTAESVFNSASDRWQWGSFSSLIAPDWIRARKPITATMAVKVKVIED